MNCSGARSASSLRALSMSAAHVERRAIARDAHSLDLDPAERHGLGDLDDVANTLERLFVEESASLQDEAVRRHASALLLERVRRPAMNFMRHASIFSLAESLELDVPRVARPTLASCDVARDPAQASRVRFERLRQDRRVLSDGVDELSDRRRAILRASRSCSGLRRRIVSFQPFALSCM